MTAAQNTTFWRIAIGAVVSFILTALSSVAGWLTLAYHEMDRTQEVVLQRLNHLETAVTIIPSGIKDDDRWRRTEELMYQESTNRRLDKLERFHQPYMWENNGRRQ